MVNKQKNITWRGYGVRFCQLRRLGCIGDVRLTKWQRSYCWSRRIRRRICFADPVENAPGVIGKSAEVGNVYVIGGRVGND